MKNRNLIFVLVLLFAVLMSIPWLVPGAGWVALFALVPLLCAERIADLCRMKRFWLVHFLGFVLWNAFTTFWIWNATAGGAVFAILYNAAQMSLIFGLFRVSKRRFGGVLPYIFLMVVWIAWERFYFSAEMSWPWLTLGNALATTTKLAQWYSVTGTLGGSLWIWGTNLAIFGLMCAFSEGSWWRMHYKAQFAALIGSVLLLGGPIAASLVMYDNYVEKSESSIDVVVGQPNIDVYHKFTSMSQAEQTASLLRLFSEAGDGVALFVAPETFTSDVVLNDIDSSATVRNLVDFLKSRPGSDMLFGASTWEITNRRSRPSLLARPYGDGWIESHNSAIVVGGERKPEVYHKSRLVVGVEKTPFPALFTRIDDMLGGVMGRCIPQKDVTCLHLKDGTAFGSAVCYESVYGEYCTGYVKEGAEFIAVITNDAWWGDTPGYHQHLSYSRLRAIELRRDIARSANTGISAFIDQKGDIVSSTAWWQPAILEGKVNLNTEITPFVKYGDIVGRVCTLAFLLMLLLLIVRTVSGGFRPTSASHARW